jgi:hypothetical protein
MQVVQPQFNALANGDVIPLAWGCSMSFKKEYDNNITFAQYDVSQYDGLHLYAPTVDNPISFWDKYKYLDYSQRIMGMEWTREFNFPYSVSAAMADFTMNNTDDFFSPDKGSTIEDYILPKRPVRLMAGYGSFNLQQFVGITEKAPTIDDLGKTASFHATDFLTEIFKVNLNQVVAMENARTDEVLAAILTQFGISPTSYQFSKGRNVIPFVFFDREKNAGNAIREIMQAEGGHLWIDEQGLIRFESRLPQPDTPSVVLDDEAVFDLTQSGDTELINQIRIKSTIRRVASYREVYSNVKTDRSALSTDGFVIPANSSRPYPADLADPCLTIEEPTVGENSSVSWFTAITADGTDVSSNIVVTGSSHTQGQFVTFIQNNNPFPIEIDQMFLWGRPALVVDTINYLAKDQESIDKYEVQQLGGDEGITNDFFGSEANARSFAQTIVDEYKDFNQVVEATIVGNLALQLNDIVYLTARGNDSYYKIKSITVNMSPFSYKIKATRYAPRSWATYDKTVYDSTTDVIAP